MIRLMIALCFISFTAYADEPPQETPFNEDILIFTGEMRNFIDTASAVKELNAGEQTDQTDKQLEEKIKILQITASRVADVYFHVAEESNRVDLTNFLGRTIQDNKELQNYFVFIGNAFASEAEKIIEARQDKMSKIMIWSSVGGVVLGLTGGFVFLKYAAPTNNGLLKAGLVAVGIAAVVSGVGFSARYFLPVARSVTNAKEFMARYPDGEDFLRDLNQVSPDLTLGFAELSGE